MDASPVFADPPPHRDPAAAQLYVKTTRRMSENG